MNEREKLAEIRRERSSVSAMRYKIDKRRMTLAWLGLTILVAVTFLHFFG
jgi:hypothetical protein